MRRKTVSGDGSAFPPPSLNDRYAGFLLKQGEVNKSWKRRWCTIDQTTSYLYWWTKPAGRVKGAIRLQKNVSVTALQSSPNSFRLDMGDHFRDFRAESSALFPVWIKHLEEQIKSVSGVGAEEPVRQRNFTLDNVSDEEEADAPSNATGNSSNNNKDDGDGDGSDYGDGSNNNSNEGEGDPAVVIEALRERVRQLERKNAVLRAVKKKQTKKADGDDDSNFALISSTDDAEGADGAVAANRMEQLELENAALRLRVQKLERTSAAVRTLNVDSDEVDNLRYELKTARKLLSQAQQRLKQYEEEQ